MANNKKGGNSKICLQRTIQIEERKQGERIVQLIGTQRAALISYYSSDSVGRADWEFRVVLY